MTSSEKLLQEFQALPDDKQQQVIDFIELLGNNQKKKLENMMDAVIVENKTAFIVLAK